MPVPRAGESVCRAHRPGVLGNPLSGRFARQPAGLRSAARHLPGGLYREASSPGEIGRSLEELAGEGADIIIVLGGDGTLQAVLDHLPGLAGGPPVPLAIVPCGSTNMTALDVGCGHSPLRVLDGLRRRLQNGEDLRLVARPVLRVRRESGPPLHGMFFGAGLIAAGVRYFRERIRGGALTGESGSAVAVLRMIVRLLRGTGSAGESAVQARLFEDASPAVEGDFLLLLASTLDRLLLGSRPYWGHEQAPVHYTAIRDRPARLWRSLPAIVRGRGDVLDAGVYRSRNLRTLDVESGADFVLDGEIHAAGGRILRIDSTGPVHFAVP